MGTSTCEYLGRGLEGVIVGQGLQVVQDPLVIRPALETNGTCPGRGGRCTKEDEDEPVGRRLLEAKISTRATEGVVGVLCGPPPKMSKLTSWGGGKMHFDQLSLELKRI